MVESGPHVQRFTWQDLLAGADPGDQPGEHARPFVLPVEDQNAQRAVRGCDDVSAVLVDLVGADPLDVVSLGYEQRRDCASVRGGRRSAADQADTETDDAADAQSQDGAGDGRGAGEQSHGQGRADREECGLPRTTQVKPRRHGDDRHQQGGIGRNQFGRLGRRDRGSCAVGCAGARVERVRNLCRGAASQPP